MSAPLCKVQVFDWGFRVSLRIPLLRALMPDTSLEWSQIKSAQASGNWLEIDGVKGCPRIYFFTTDAVAIAVMIKGEAALRP